MLKVVGQMVAPIWIDLTHAQSREDNLENCVHMEKLPQALIFVD
jgi:hypothetical protein